MREILFRGKSTNNKIWQYGLLTLYTNKRCVIKSQTGFYCDAISETVGQFTGLTDKNGTMIFEGDIVKFIDCVDEVSPFSEKISYIYWFKEYCEFSLRDSQMAVSHVNEMEVIGNIHDNTELLK